MTSKTELYRWFDENGMLLYVGITSDPKRREAEHRRQSRWFYLATQKRTEEYPNRSAAMNAEAVAIETEAPKFNVDLRKINSSSVNPPQEYLQDMAKWTVNIFGEYVVGSDCVKSFRKYSKPILEDYI